MSVRLVARGVHVAVRRRALLHDVDLHARSGEMLALVGPSGSGKTTLLSVLAGDLAPAAGSVEVDDRPLTPGDPAHTARLGRVLQLHALVPVLTAAENVEIALRARGVRGAEAERRAGEALERVGLGEAAHRLAAKLSGGQQQRVAVARAFAPAPDLLLTDEPTSELDAATRDRVVVELRAEADRGALVLIATHDLDVARACDRTVHLRGGRVEAG